MMSEENVRLYLKVCKADLENEKFQNIKEWLEGKIQAYRTVLEE